MIGGKIRCERCRNEVTANCIAAVRICTACGSSTWHFATEHFDRLKGLDSRALASALDKLYHVQGATQ